MCRHHRAVYQKNGTVLFVPLKNFSCALCALVLVVWRENFCMQIHTVRDSVVGCVVLVLSYEFESHSHFCSPGEDQIGAKSPISIIFGRLAKSRAWAVPHGNFESAICVAFDVPPNFYLCHMVSAPF